MSVPAGSASRVPRWLPQVLGYALSAACLVYVLRGYQFSTLIEDIRTLDWRWVMLAVVADLGTYAIHGWRWNTLLNPIARPGFWRTVQAIYIGLFANEVLPLRPGEVIRCYLVAHWNSMRISLSLASIGVERIIDGLWLLVAFAITANYVKLDEKWLIPIELMAVTVFVGVIILLWVMTRRQEAHAVFREGRWAATLRHVVEGLHLMGNPRTLIFTTFISLLYLVIQVVPFYALLQARHFDLGFWAAGALMVMVRLGTVVPSAPGNLGLFQAACTMALRRLEVAPEDARDFSVFFFFGLTLPLLIGGAVATAFTGLNLGEIRERARTGAISPDQSNSS